MRTQGFSAILSPGPPAAPAEGWCCRAPTPKFELILWRRSTLRALLFVWLLVTFIFHPQGMWSQRFFCLDSAQRTEHVESCLKSMRQLHESLNQAENIRATSKCIGSTTANARSVDSFATQPSKRSMWKFGQCGGSKMDCDQLLFFSVTCSWQPPLLTVSWT